MDMNCQQMGQVAQSVLKVNIVMEHMNAGSFQLLRIAKSIQGQKINVDNANLVVEFQRMVKRVKYAQKKRMGLMELNASKFQDALLEKLDSQHHYALNVTLDMNK